MRIVKKLICLALVTFTMMSALLLLVGATNDESHAYEENPTADFVLIVDCSNSIPGTDPYHLCKTACKMLMDMLPLENARIAVIGFASNQVGEKYVLDHLDYFDYIKDPDTKEYATLRRNVIMQEADKVRLIIPLTPISELRKNGIESYKNEMVSAIDKEGKGTFIGMSTVAAIDLLEKSGASPENACIIVLSDGDNATVKLTFEPRVDIEMQKGIAKVAGDEKHKWPMYALQVNAQGSRDTSDWESDLQRMLQMAVDSGAGGEGEGRYLLEDFSEGSQQIATAFLSMFKRFIGHGEITTGKVGIDETIPFEIDSIVSEATIVVAGAGVDELLLEHGEDISLRANTVDFNVVAQNLSSEEYYVSGETGRYICVKLVCPEPGPWIAKIKFSGKKDSEFVFYQCNLSDMDLVLKCEPSIPEIIDKTSDQYRLEATFRYQGTLVKSEEAVEAKAVFEKMDVEFHAKNNITNDDVILNDLDKFRYNATSTGYNATVSMESLLDAFSEDEGSYSVYVKVKGDMFRGNVKYSNVVGPFKNVNYSIEKVKDIEPQVGDHNKSIGEIKLIPTYLKNPDGDSLKYTLECVSDELDFISNIVDGTLENDTLCITNCGSMIGDFDMLLTVTEPSRNAQNDPVMLEYPFTLKVANETPDYPHALEPVSLLIHPICKELIGDSREDSITLQLADPELCQDPDGDALVFSDFKFENIDGEQAVSYLYDPTVSELSILGQDTGSAVITFMVSDGYSEPEMVLIPVEVVNGWSVFFGWLIKRVLPIVAGLLIIAFILRQINNNIRVKGTWNIQAIINGDPEIPAIPATATVDICASLDIGERKKFPLSALVGVLSTMITDNKQAASKMPSFFSGNNVGGINGDNSSNIFSGDNVGGVNGDSNNIDDSIGSGINGVNKNPKKNSKKRANKNAGTAAGQLEMKGVLGPVGFVLQKIPADQSVKVTFNGFPKTGKVKVSGGRLQIRVMGETDEFGGQTYLDLTITPAKN